MRKRLNVMFIRTYIIRLVESYVLKFNTLRLGKRIGPSLEAYFFKNKMVLHNNFHCD